MSQEDKIGVVLAEVRDMGPATVRAIAAGTGYSASTVRRYLGQLREAGLVESDDYQRRSRVWMDARS
jgi:DNA-binding IclR family transcriptional regulator